MKELLKICIVANGEFPTKESALDLLREADLTVCCDGAFEKYFHCGRWREAKGRVAVVGDGDSLPMAVIEQARAAGLAFDHRKVSEQDYNDLTKAVRYAMRWAADSRHLSVEVAIVGATGLREDHTLGNISLLAYYQEQYPGVSFRMVTDHGVFYPVQGHASFATYSGQQVSIVSLTPGVAVSAKGLKWPLENRCLEWWWQATLNEALGDSFEVQGGRLLVYLVD